MVGEAVPNHWRKVPGFKELKVLEIPEASSRVAMLETGQAEIVNVSLKDVARMTGLGMTAVRNGAYAISTIWPAGNFWQEKNPTTGVSIFPRPGFKPDKDHPWIGDPRDPEQMERARKVRWAMSMAIDREAINKAILGGLGVPAYVPTLSSNDGLYQPKWKMDFDPAKAKALLTEAGYPAGFKFTFFIPPDSGIPPEIGEAVAAMWANIGLATEIERTSYAVRRPTEVKREIDIPWLFSSGPDTPVLDRVNVPAWAFDQAGWNPGFEAQEMWDWFRGIATEANEAKRKQLMTDRLEFFYKWQVGIAVLEVPTLVVYNPKKVRTGWQSHFEIVTTAGFNRLEYAEPVS